MQGVWLSFDQYASLNFCNTGISFSHVRVFRTYSYLGLRLYFRGFTGDRDGRAGGLTRTIIRFFSEFS